jgi:hypothetical protein
VKKPTKDRKSPLAKQAEKFFSFNNDAVGFPPLGNFVEYSNGPVIVHTFTTYSVCEEPIPDPRKYKAG